MYDNAFWNSGFNVYDYSIAFDGNFIKQNADNLGVVKVPLWDTVDILERTQFHLELLSGKHLTQ